ncbi:MAG TPA: ABC transporter ATP-binding protein [Candidatus Cloacimonadota bacterium]|nr:ABC transporter ATP-binding protein [Candidatus Cloacimonadota bacterium]HQL14257.1 ABC transporter ATP-binding protein [Candidatus Cloacimonadota bacterium]
MAVLIVEHLAKSFRDSNLELRILEDINLTLEKGEFACISGQSGCGKSTLLHLLGLLDKPNSGKITLNGEVVSPEAPNAHQIRNKYIGFVFQFHYLMEELTALENVALPLMVAGHSRKYSLNQAKEMLAELDMLPRQNFYPNRLSGGEQQRVALGRALINQPALVLADEPTGNLDPAHCSAVLELFFKFNAKLDTAFLLVTHDPNIAKQFSKNYKLINGVLSRNSE